jgi:hypothetical protein
MNPLYRFLFLFSLCLLLAGCGGKEEPEPSPASAARGAPRGGAAQRVRGQVEDVKTVARLKNLYLTYQMAAIGGRPPRSFDDLLEHTEKVSGMFQSARDKQEFEVAWGTDLSQASGAMLAWEKTADSNGGRCVLTANGSATYLSKEEFEKTPKANKK